MGAVKNHYHDEIERSNAIEAGERLCIDCEDELAVEEGRCRTCFDAINEARAAIAKARGDQP